MVNLVARPGIEPGTGAYETPVLPLHYLASIFTLLNKLRSGLVKGATTGLLPQQGGRLVCSTM
jgi:hypothetical protein